MGPVTGGAGGAPDPIDEEFEFHLAACAAELERTGLSPGEARAEAERRFGRLGVHERACRREASEERMRRVLQGAMAVTIVALAAATATLGFVAWRQSRQLGELARKEAVSGPRAMVDATPPAAVWASYEDGTGRVNRIGLPADDVLTANQVSHSFGAGRDGKPYRVTVVPTTVRPRRLDEWKLAGRDVILVDGLEAVTYVRDPSTPQALRDFPLMSGDRILVSWDTQALAGARVARGLSAYSIAGDVRWPGSFSADVELTLSRLMVLAGGYTGPEGSTVIVRVMPHSRVAERVRQWAQSGGQVVERTTGPALIHHGDLRRNSFWEKAPAIAPDDQVTVTRAE